MKRSSNSIPSESYPPIDPGQQQQYKRQADSESPINESHARNSSVENDTDNFGRDAENSADIDSNRSQKKPKRGRPRLERSQQSQAEVCSFYSM